MTRVAATTCGSHHAVWASYKQRQEIVAQVHKSEKADHVVFDKDYEIDLNLTQPGDVSERTVVA